MSQDAGEVYGERSILSTEVNELESRLFNLSEERDKSLSVLDEVSSGQTNLDATWFAQSFCFVHLQFHQSYINTLLTSVLSHCMIVFLLSFRCVEFLK